MQSEFMKTKLSGSRTGLCLWFTGLPCSGKTTIAKLLNKKLMEKGRITTLLDGDAVRTHLSKGLGFSKEDRAVNVLRIAFVAAEIVKHHGIAICSAVSPYEKIREEAEKMIGPEKFILIYVNTPLEICEKRDVKGMYAKARRGEIRQFTGVDDPYEPPTHPDLELNTILLNPEECAERVLNLIPF
ncbi:MAG: adenylyl-sulfate kinase [Candidatus Eremiobacteraeota bacterium]|nr:adenylyl-sulfate kinase [Candidatus Eremiobacteraeota bacterium]MCL5054817.1 adenylyl-sulfate kinase [Bacillota bacterium]